MSIPPPPSYNHSSPLPKSQPEYRTYGAAEYERILTRSDSNYIRWGSFSLDETGHANAKIVRYKASEFPGYNVPEEMEYTDDMLIDKNYFSKIMDAYNDKFNKYNETKALKTFREKYNIEFTKVKQGMPPNTSDKNISNKIDVDKIFIECVGIDDDTFKISKEFQKIRYGFIMQKETAPFINLKTLTYRPFNPVLIRNKIENKIEDKDEALADVLIEFMNMQEVPTRIKLAKALTELCIPKNNNGTIPYITFQYTTSEDNRNPKLTFYGFDIITYIQNTRKHELLDDFLVAMFSLKTDNPKMEYKGFDLKSLNRGNTNSYAGKKLKYQGMINCCINNNDPEICKHLTSTFGIKHRKKNPTLCSYPASSNSPPSNPVPRTIFSGGRRRTRHKRKTRRTRRMRR